MKKYLLILLLPLLVLIQGCADTTGHATGVYMLMDTSGTYARELEKAKAIINYLLGTLQPGDSLAVARIDSGSFSEKDIIQKTTFNTRPSVSNDQKRVFSQKVNNFIKNTKGSSHTDITGGALQAVEYLNETKAANKYIFVFSDLEEDLAKGRIRDFPVRFDGIKVIALNVTKLRSDNIDPRDYLKRLEEWKKRVESGGGSWKVINDLERLDRILAD
ncbi:MAG: VWA domain-containing protein [Thermodesulfobacteriota bacterium]